MLAVSGAVGGWTRLIRPQDPRPGYDYKNEDDDES
jgi:hypothetical protein